MENDSEHMNVNGCIDILAQNENVDKAPRYRDWNEVNSNDIVPPHIVNKMSVWHWSESKLLVVSFGAQYYLVSYSRFCKHDMIDPAFQGSETGRHTVA